VYHVKAYFVQGFPPIKALAENYQPTVRWVGLTEKYKSGIKFLFKIKLLVATGYAPLLKDLRHTVRFRQKTRGMAQVRIIFLLRYWELFFTYKAVWRIPLILLFKRIWVGRTTPPCGGVEAVRHGRRCILKKIQTWMFVFFLFLTTCDQREQVVPPFELLDN
jgi:hypothetical protein